MTEIQIENTKHDGMDKQIELPVGPPHPNPVQQNFKIKIYHLFKIHFAKTRQRHICIKLDFTVSHHSTITFLFVLEAGESIYYYSFLSMM